MRYISCGQGKWSFLVERETGFVRELHYAGERVASAIYCAVRGADWSTYPVAISDLQWGDSWCSWQTRAVGAPFAWRTEARVDGSSFQMSIDGTASETFQTCRTGLCLLHPLSVCGLEATVTHVDGSQERSVFPRLVAPHQPFLEMAGLRYRAASGAEVEIQLEGEVFETEDQRNWSDASFKTYCHRLGDGKPYTLQAGQPVWQQIRIRCAGEAQGTPSERVWQAPLPALSVWLDSATEQALSNLKQMGVRRVAIEDPKALPLLAQVGIAVDLRLSVEQVGQTLPMPPPASGSTLWLVSDKWTLEVEALVQQVEAEWKPLGWELGYGSSANFAELNRSRPPQGRFDWLATAASPQVHTFDAWSILQNAESFASIGETMRAMDGEARLGVAPLRFESRFTGEDPRADSPLAVAYLIRSLASMAQGGFARVVTGRASYLLREGSSVGALLRDLERLQAHAVQYTVRDGVERVQFLGAQGSALYLVNPSPEEREGVAPFSSRREE